jgi:hypothetical protein
MSRVDGATIAFTPSSSCKFWRTCTTYAPIECLTCKLSQKLGAYHIYIDRCATVVGDRLVTVNKSSDIEVPVVHIGQVVHTIRTDGRCMTLVPAPARILIDFVIFSRFSVHEQSTGRVQDSADIIVLFVTRLCCLI